jgi:hypothetical protein
MIFRLAILASIVLAIVLVINAFRTRKDDPKRRRREKERKIEALHEELLSLCHDEGVAESLVESEMLQNPQLNEVQCYRRAIKKLEYDRSR